MGNDRLRTMRAFRAVLILVAIATHAHALKVSDDDELVYLNITMSDVSTTQVVAMLSHDLPFNRLFSCRKMRTNTFCTRCPTKSYSSVSLQGLPA